MGFRAFCDHSCRWLEKFRLITAYTAKRNYFLTEDDLLPLRTISNDNPRSGKTGGHIRYFSRVSAQRRSDEILRAMATTRQARLTQQRRRSEKASQRWHRSMLARIQQVRTLLMAHRFHKTHYCDAVDAFARTRWIDYRARIRWTIDDVLNVCLAPGHIR
jgi:hypothetical protein